VRRGPVATLPAVHWTAVVNPAAGRRGRRGDVARLRDALTAAGATVRITADAAEGRAVAADAFAAGHGVVACGGDGTVLVLAETAAAADGLLAIVATGSGNDFARALGLDHQHPLAAVDLLRTGREVRCDLARATAADGTEVVFTTVANSGLDGEVNRWANTVQRLTGTALYTVAALRTMATYRPGSMRITVDDVVVDGPTWLVAIGNTDSYGGGMRITPAARADDGLLDVVVVGDVSRPTVLGRFPQMMRGRHLGIRGITHLTGRRVMVEGVPGQDLWASGEPVGPLPATLEALPGALRVLVPTGADGGDPEVSPRR